MPLQNRPDPSGGLHAVADLGPFMGNRGGRFDRDDQALEDGHWISGHWISGHWISGHWISGRWIFCAARFKEGLVWPGHLRANATIDSQDGAARARSFRGYRARQPLHAAGRRLTPQITRDALQPAYAPTLHPSETA